MLPFLAVATAAVVAVVLLVRRRTRAVGFDIGEAASYVWEHLDRNQKRRIAFAHVAAALEAERDASGTVTETELKATLAEAAIDAGAVLYERDLDDLLRLQYDYANAKGLL